MYANKHQFVQEVTNAYSKIKAQNSWAKQYFELEMRGVALPQEQEVSAARCWDLYVASRDNALKMLLLGEVSMRSKLALVQNFGLTSAFGHEDEEPWLSPWLGTPIKDLQAATLKLKDIDPATLDANKHLHLKKLQGSGSILSDRLWTPLMNDAWLLGGVHSLQSFHLVTEGLGEKKLVASMDALRHQEKFERTRAVFGDAHKPRVTASSLIRDVWRQWFLDNPRCLYESWGPRVLVRELIGLMSFGYEPNFNRLELGFTCVDQVRAGNATIVAYADNLELFGFQRGSEAAGKDSVLRRLSTWMFGREDALT